MTRIQIDDLPLLQDLSQEELQGIFGEGLFPAERLRQMAAAATLGISLVSAPFATAGGPSKGQGPSQGGRSWSPGPSHTSSPVHTQHHTQPGHVRQASWHGGWQGGDWRGEGEGGDYNYFEVEGFCKEHGVKFSHGFFYVGRDQKHFTSRWYDAHFETYLYSDPYAHCPYYWCEAHGVFYPIQYIETVGPGAKGPGP